jgi:lysophospholipase L1-like esterase
MTVGTKLANISYLSVANPPSRDSGMTIAGWVFIPAGSYSGFHNMWSIHYSGNNVSECVQFQSTDSNNAVLMVIDYPPYFETISTKNFTNGKWWYFAYVWSNNGGTITITTYWSDTPGSSLTSVDSRVVTSHIGESPDSFDIGAAQGWDRYLLGTIQYVGLWETALSLEQLAEQSISKTPITSSWVFISGENGDYTDKSGNSRTVTATGTVTTSDVGIDFAISGTIIANAGAPITTIIGDATTRTTGNVIANAGGAIASIVGISETAISTGVVTANVGAPIAIITGDATHTTGIITTAAGAPIANVSGIIDWLSTDIICYGNSVTAGYGISDPSLHYPEQLAILLGSRIGQVTKLGYSGQTTATLLDQFEERVLPVVRTNHPTIVIFQEGFNSAHSGVDAATILSEMWATCVKCHDNNLKVIVQDISKADADSQSHEDTCLIVNAGLVENWTTYADGFVGLRDFFYNPLDPIMYQSDGAHFTALGLHVLAEINYSEVNRLLLGNSYVTTGTITTNAGAPVASLVGVVEPSIVTGIVTANIGGATALIIGDAVHTTGTISANIGGAIASIIGDAVHTTGTISANIGAPVSSIDGYLSTTPTGIIVVNAGASVASIIGDAVHTTGTISANIGGATASINGNAKTTQNRVITMGTDYIFANTGQTVRFVIDTLNADGYRSDGYVPVVESIIFPDMSLASGYPQAMTNIDRGLYAHGILLPTGADALGAYIASVFWVENNLPKYQTIVINAARPFGISSVSPI